MKEIFLIRKEVSVKNSIQYFDSYNIELEVIKEMEGFILGEVILINRWQKISELIKGIDTNIWIKSLGAFDGKYFSRDEFITIEDWRDRKLKEILL